MTPRYLELAETARNLQAEYDKKASELDPLRWKLIAAQREAASEWRRAVYAAETAAYQQFGKET